MIRLSRNQALPRRALAAAVTRKLTVAAHGHCSGGRWNRVATFSQPPSAQRDRQPHLDGGERHAHHLAVHPRHRPRQIAPPRPDLVQIDAHLAVVRRTQQGAKPCLYGAPAPVIGVVDAAAPGRC